MLNEMKSAFGGNKLFKSLLISVFALFLFAGTSFAATSVRLQTPASQTNQDTISLTFVALDTTSFQAITVKCFKTGPSDSGAYSQFGGDIVTSAGGNTGTCNANLNEGNGTYKFYVEAQGTSFASTQTNPGPVSIDFNNTAPETPQYVGKDKISACVNRIKFKTANDGGKTVKVEIYRADKTTFDANSGSRIGTVTVGSDIYKEYDDTLVNCDTVFYYAIRAFDAYGNGSGVVGDSNVTTTTTTTASNAAGATPTQGAIPVSGGTGGSVLGAGTKTTEKEVLGTESAVQKPTASPASTAPKVSQNPALTSINWITGHKKISLSVLILILAGLGLGYFFYRRSKNLN